MQRWRTRHDIRGICFETGGGYMGPTNVLLPSFNPFSSSSAGPNPAQANTNVGLFQVPISLDFLNPSATAELSYSPTVTQNPYQTGIFNNNLEISALGGPYNSAHASIFGGGGSSSGGPGGGGGNVSGIDYNPVNILSSNPPPPLQMAATPNLLSPMPAFQTSMMPMPPSQAGMIMPTTQPIAAGGVSPVLASMMAIPQQQQLSQGQIVIPGSASQAGGYDQPMQMPPMPAQQSPIPGLPPLQTPMPMPMGGANAMGIPNMGGGMGMPQMAPSAAPGNIMTPGGNQVPFNQITAQTVPQGWQSAPEPDEQEMQQSFNLPERGDRGVAGSLEEQPHTPSVDFKDLSTDAEFQMGMNNVMNLQKALGAKAAEPTIKLQARLSELDKQVSKQHDETKDLLDKDLQRINHNLNYIGQFRQALLDPRNIAGNRHFIETANDVYHGLGFTQRVNQIENPTNPPMTWSQRHPVGAALYNAVRGTGLGLGAAAGLGGDPYGTPYQRAEIRARQQGTAQKANQYAYNINEAETNMGLKTQLSNLDHLENMGRAALVDNRQRQHENDIQARDYYRYHANNYLREAQGELAALRTQGTIANNISTGIKAKQSDIRKGQGLAIQRVNAGANVTKAGAAASQANTAIKRENRLTAEVPQVGQLRQSEINRNNAIAAQNIDRDTAVKTFMTKHPRFSRAQAEEAYDSFFGK